MENENIEVKLADAEESPIQQYEGDEISALETAKARMAQRDAEYLEKFRSLTEEAPKKPASKPKAKRSPVKEKPKAEPAKPTVDSFTDEEPVPKQVVAEKAVQAPESNKPGPTELRFRDVNGGLRSLKGGSTIPASNSDQAEFSKAWKKLN